MQGVNLIKFMYACMQTSQWNSLVQLIYAKKKVHKQAKLNHMYLHNPYYKPENLHKLTHSVFNL
jgi:hypothetical protein